VASCAATTEAPHWRESRRGRIPKEPLALYEGGPVTLCSQPKSSSFWTLLLWVWEVARQIWTAGYRHPRSTPRKLRSGASSIPANSAMCAAAFPRSIVSGFIPPSGISPPNRQSAKSL